MSLSTIEAQAVAEIEKIADPAVKEYLLLKAKSYSFKVVAIVGGAALVLGFILGHL